MLFLSVAGLIPVAGDTPKATKAIGEFSQKNADKLDEVADLLNIVNKNMPDVAKGLGKSDEFVEAVQKLTKIDTAKLTREQAEAVREVLSEPELKKYLDEATNPWIRRVSESGSIGVLNNANYAQKTYSNTFSTEGRKIYSALVGEPINTVDDLVNAINLGKVNVTDLPIEYIVRDGNTLILNTRTSQALTRAGIPRSQWNGIDRTGDDLFEELLTGQLSRNNLTSEGISIVRPSGGQ